MDRSPPMSLILYVHEGIGASLELIDHPEFSVPYCRCPFLLRTRPAPLFLPAQAMPGSRCPFSLCGHTFPVCVWRTLRYACSSPRTSGALQNSAHSDSPMWRTSCSALSPVSIPVRPHARVQVHKDIDTLRPAEPATFANRSAEPMLVYYYLSIRGDACASQRTGSLYPALRSAR